MPTWVPQWNKLSINILAGVDGKSHAVAAGLPFWKTFGAGEDPNSLIVQGLEVDTVTCLTDTMKEEDFRASEDIWDRRVQQLFGQPQERDLRTLAWTMTAGKDWADEPVRDTESHWADFVAWWAQVSADSVPLGETNQRSADTPGNAKRFLVAASDCWDRRLFVTEKMSLALGPEALQAGDVVCILAGGPVPYVLRKKNGYYFLVGECYVYGMMGCEAVDHWREGRLHLRKFELR
jgi:hypothetical protein